MPTHPPDVTPQGFSTFGDLLRYLRERAHLSQRELAALVGYHFSYISYLEKNARMVDEAVLLVRFVPALGLEDKPEWVNRLLELVKIKTERAHPAHKRVEPATSVEIANSLPISLTSMIGREYEFAQIQNLILNPGVRLVSILGPPGVGKTCLALHVAHAVKTAFQHGVLFVDLTPVRKPQFLFPAIARALNIHDASSTTAEEAVQSALAEKCQLLILDNFEQVVDAAPLLLPLLAPVPDLRILVTSREVLRLRGEREFHLKPLPVPEPHQNTSLERLIDIPSIKLFVERAQAVNPEFKLDEKNASHAAEICSHLDGLPLAIELAAARTRAMPLTSIIEQVNRRFEWLSHGARDLPAWRQTLQGTVEWSLALLSDSERALFRRLAIFNGGWTLESAIEICHDANLCKRADIFSLLIQLIDKSLVLPENEDGHFAFLETLREFAFRELTHSGELDFMQDKHCAWFLNFIQTANPHIKQGNDQALWLERVEREHDNLRAALAWTLDTPKRADTAMALGESIHIFWLTHGYMTEARSWLKQILTLDPSPVPIRANLLRYAADYASSQGDFSQSSLYEKEAMYISKQIGDEDGVYYSMDGIAMTAGMQGDYVSAIELLEQVYVYWKNKANVLRLVGTLNNLAFATRLNGNLERAKQLYEEAIHVTRQNKILDSLARALNGLADIYILENDYLAAFPLMRESVLLRHELGDLKGMASSLNSLSLFAEKQDKSMLAAILAGAEAHIREEIGYHIEPAKRLNYDAAFERLQSTLGKKKFQRAWSQGQSMPQAELAALIKSLDLPLYSG